MVGFSFTYSTVVGFESLYSHLIFRYWTCFEQGVPLHSGNYRVKIHSKHLRDMIKTHSYWKYLCVFPLQQCLCSNTCTPFCVLLRKASFAFWQTSLSNFKFLEQSNSIRLYVIHHKLGITTCFFCWKQVQVKLIKLIKLIKIKKAASF